MLTEVAKVLLHLRRAGSAVDTDDVGLHCLQGCVCGTNLGADQHATGRFHGDLHLDGNLAANRLHGAAAGLHRGLDLQKVHAGFDEEEIGTAIKKATGLFFVGIAQCRKINMAETWQLGAWSDASGHVAGTSV